MKPRVFEEVYGGDEQEWNNTYNYYKGIQEKNDRIENMILEDQVYVVDNKIKTRSGTEAAKAIVDNLRSSLSYGDFQFSDLAPELVNPDGSLKDFSSDTHEGVGNRRRLAEKVTRMNTLSMLGRDLESNNEGKRNLARKAVLHMSQVCGGNVNDLLQLMATNGKGTFAFSQTGLMKYFCTGEDTKIVRRGSGFDISRGGYEARLGMERTSGSKKEDINGVSGNTDTASTRHVLEFTPETVKKAGIQFGKEEALEVNHSFNLFLKGQMELLEKIFNQTNGNLLL